MDVEKILRTSINKFVNYTREIIISENFNLLEGYEIILYKQGIHYHYILFNDKYLFDIDNIPSFVSYSIDNIRVDFNIEIEKMILDINKIINFSKIASYEIKSANDLIKKRIFYNDFFLSLIGVYTFDSLC